jgi:hypothetical protein
MTMTGPAATPRHATEEHAAPAHRLLEDEDARLRRDVLPATSLIGASSGRRPRASVTVS